jgi:hypothetical protein
VLAATILMLASLHAALLLLSSAEKTADRVGLVVLPRALVLRDA